MYEFRSTKYLRDYPKLPKSHGGKAKLMPCHHCKAHKFCHRWYLRSEKKYLWFCNQCWR